MVRFDSRYFVSDHCMFRHILLGLFFFYVVLRIFIKLRFRFWAEQPVFHVYNIYYWLFPPGILQHGPPPLTKYYDPDIQCLTWSDLEVGDKDLFYYLISQHYLNTKEKTTYRPRKKQVMAYFEGQGDESYISLAFSTKDNRRLVGAMTSRTLLCKVHNHNIKVSYVDFLCVTTSRRKQGMAPKIIYTHYRKSRRLGANPIFLFKREGTVNFMVPLAIYQAHAFSCSSIKTNTTRLNPSFRVERINCANIHIFWHYLKEVEATFPCFIRPVASHIKTLVQEKLLCICILLYVDDPIGCYIFRDPQTTYDGKDSLECVASYYSTGYRGAFVQAFATVLKTTLAVIPASILLIESISRNEDLVNETLRKRSTLWTCPMAYYFYNFIYRPFLPKDVFLLN